MRTFISFLFLSIAATLVADDVKPWYGNNLEVEAKAAYLLQRYPAVDPGKIKASSYDHFVVCSLAVPYDRWCVELEGALADTFSHSFSGDHLHIIGRYQWLDDLVGDVVSLTTGATLGYVFRAAQRDISTFHHGALELEGHLAFGREVSRRQFWLWRWWGFFAFGTGNVGRPWIRAELDWEFNFHCTHQLCLFSKGLWGLGHDDLKIKHFKGYGNIAHQSIDLGFSYHYLLPDWHFHIDYARRLFARNSPKRVDRLSLHVIYPFGL